MSFLRPTDSRAESRAANSTAVRCPWSHSSPLLPPLPPPTRPRPRPLLLATGSRGMTFWFLAGNRALGLRRQPIATLQHDGRGHMRAATHHVTPSNIRLYWSRLLWSAGCRERETEEVVIIEAVFPPSLVFLLSTYISCTPVEEKKTGCASPIPRGNEEILLRSLSSHSGGGEHCIDRWFINQMCRKKPLLLKQRTLLILHCTARAVQTTYYYGFPIVHKTVLVYTSS